MHTILISWCNDSSYKCLFRGLFWRCILSYKKSIIFILYFLVYSSWMLNCSRLFVTNEMCIHIDIIVFCPLHFKNISTSKYTGCRPLPERICVCIYFVCYGVKSKMRIIVKYYNDTKPHCDSMHRDRWHINTSKLFFSIFFTIEIFKKKRCIHSFWNSEKINHSVYSINAINQIGCILINISLNSIVRNCKIYW